MGRWALAGRLDLYRARWEWGHAIISLVDLAGFAALIGAVLADTPNAAAR